MICDFGRNHVKTILIQDHQFELNPNLESLTSRLVLRIPCTDIEIFMILYMGSPIHGESSIANTFAKRLKLMESHKGAWIIFMLEKDAFVLCYFRSSWMYVRNVLILDYYFFFLRTSFPIQVISELTNRWNKWKTVYSCFQLFCGFLDYKAILRSFKRF